MTASLGDRLCSVLAAGTGQDPICTAGSITALMAIETPAPWGDNLYTADVQGTLLQRIRAEQVAYFEELRSHEGWQARLSEGYRSMYGIQPDREWSQPDRRRVLLALRPEGLASEYEMSEYVFPWEAPAIVEFTRAFFQAPEDLQGFDAFRVQHAGHPEFFVCTHGHVDICCAKFGIPLYRQARAAYPRVRAWRMTHFGGHRYAPTAWEFPSGYKWAFLDEDTARSVIDRDVDAADLAAHLRGWSGAPTHAQAVDREGLKRFGWRWLSFRRKAEVVDAAPDANRWRVRLDFESPEGERGAFEGVVVVARELQAGGCGPHSGEHEHTVPEYTLQSLHQTWT